MQPGNRGNFKNHYIERKKSESENMQKTLFPFYKKKKW